MSTAVRSRVFKISAAAVTAAIAIGLCLFSQDDVSASIKERRVERLNAQIENVYTDEYQQMMDTEIADERDAKERTVDSIYTKVNPYGTNTTSMYVYFTTDQASTKHFVGMNRLGKLVKIINLGDQYILHHDYALDSDGNIVSLATDLKHSDHAVQDQVIKVDTDSGEVSLLVDFGDLFPDYKQSTDHSGIDESDPTATNRWDWIHFNTIQLMDDGSALLSARETSTMIKINDIEGTPSLDYMIGEPSVWNGMDAQPSFLTKVGDFGDTGGQHSITVQYDSSLEDGQYYIYMFDNNFGYAMTRPDFDWTVIDGISTAQSSKDENSNSQFRKYLVDENAGTYTEVQDFDVPYSPYVSSVQELSDDLNLVDTGMQGLFGVYDDDGNLKAQYKMVLSSGYIYRAYQYGFRGFYFA